MKFLRKHLLLSAVSILAFAFAAYAGMTIECPYCHNSDLNTKGHCVLRQRVGHCREDYYGQHYNKSSCPWCSGRGHMSRWDAWMD